MGFSHVEEVERRLIRRERHSIDHRCHIVVFWHEGKSIEVAVDRRGRVQYQKRDKRMRAIAKLLFEESRQE